MKVVSIVGARPQFIKHAPLSREMRKYHEVVVVHTGQHYDYDLSKLFFDELEIPQADYDLGVGSSTHSKQTGDMLVGIEEILVNEKPALVIVYGDTNSTLAGALAAAKLNIPIAHVEAGMRNFDMRKPEEVNRILTDHVSQLLFTVTDSAVDNLRKEGITKGVFKTGDVTMDNFMKFKDLVDFKSHILDELKISDAGYLLLTVHKQKNTDDVERLSTIVKAMSLVEDTVVFPMHPRTRRLLKEHDLWSLIENSNIIVTRPVGYFDFIALMKHSKKIVTDSGGVQREAYLLKVPCITLRETEWVETVRDGWNILVDVNVDEIVEVLGSFSPSSPQKNIFGEPGACRRIVEIINTELQ